MKSQSQRASRSAEKAPVQRFDIESFAARHGGVTPFKFKSGTRLYAQGQPADCLFYVDCVAKPD
jgi:hypothetical protein